MTSKPYSSVAVLMDMQLLLATSNHKADEPFWRIELCPPLEVCRNWTMAQWDKFCKDCVEVLDATHFKWEPVKTKDGRPVIDKRAGQPKVKVSGRHTMLAKSQYVATVHFDTDKPHVHIVVNRLTMDVVANLALPETQSSLGGVQSNNNLPKKKDEVWYWWKRNGFIRQQNNRGRKR